MLVAIRRWCAAAVCFSLACVADPGGPPPVAGDAVMPLDPIAESYVKLVLAVGGHDGDYVDAYYGPQAWREQATLGLEVLRRRASELIAAVDKTEADGADELVRLRQRYLATQLRAVAARIDMLDGATLAFDEESKALYDAVAPTHPEEYFQRLLAELSPLLPGEGSVSERYARFRDEFVIPRDRLDAVFKVAIDACRERTGRHLDLPAGEDFRVEYVTDKPWSAYNWYKGGYQSLIQVNAELPIHIDRAIDLACHEGYPGHHVYNALLEKHLVRERGWVEFSVYPLFSPQSLIAEGTANYGIQVAFPGNTRVEFEQRTLFPAAGLEGARAARYYEVQEKAEQLSYAGNEAARRYLNGEIDAAEAADWLTRYALMAPPRAAQRVRFIDRYRSYVINYNLGQDLVRGYIDKVSGGGEDPARVWEEFGKLLSSPRLPSGLQ